jgi:hypothetical protein
MNMSSSPEVPPTEQRDDWRGPLFGSLAVALAFMGALLYFVAIDERGAAPVPSASLMESQVCRTPAAADVPGRDSPPEDPGKERRP